MSDACKRCGRPIFHENGKVIRTCYCSWLAKRHEPKTPIASMEVQREDMEHRRLRYPFGGSLW